MADGLKAVEQLSTFTSMQRSNLPLNPQVMASKVATRIDTAAGGLLLTAGTLYLGFAVDRTDFWSLFGAFVVAFVGYLLLVWRPALRQLKWLVGLGILLRLALVFAFPLLSDDVYRFIWDGHLIVAGENPFAQLPAYYLEAAKAVPGLTPELFDRLNSAEYHTIYPPVAQGVFTLAAWLSPGSWYGAAVVMKLFLLACELGTLWVLWRLFGAGNKGGKGGRNKGGKGERNKGEASKPKSEAPRTQRPNGPTAQLPNLLFYWLNPLILVEIMGNLHFEGAMVFFLLLAYYLLQRSKWIAAGAAMAASVASKLLPMLLLPLLIRRLTASPRPAGKQNILSLNAAWLLAKDYWWQLLFGSKPFWLFSVAFGVSCGLFFAPLLLSEGFLAGFGSSLELYQKKFEFNASLYYLARAYGYFDVGWNQIAVFGPLLARASAGGILLLALLDRRRDWASLPVGWMWAFLLYLLCATTVHPWYLSVPIALSCFTRWRFPLVWSFLIMLTYTNYLTVPYRENLWLVAVEYLLVAGFAGWEWGRVELKKY